MTTQGSALPKTQLLRVRCVRKEKQAWSAEADRLGITLSSWVRKACNHAVDAACGGREG